MKKAVILFFILVLSAYSEVKMKRVKITEGISVSIPTEFTPMSEDEKRAKFPSSKNILAMFKGKNTQVNFGVNVSRALWKEEDLQLMGEFYRSSIYNLYDKVNIINEDIRKINKREFLIFEFTSFLEGSKSSVMGRGSLSEYHYLMYTIVDGKTLIFNLSCPVFLQNQYEETVQRIMKSVKVSDFKWENQSAS
ncbi:hypothetical protein [Xanthovirga aplysinae]|uniref:hypothetical protein n=1 Tax=Xanthovirga aplysinae TaxID=2529853 RepID=UPI0012BC9F74|nr:hypothetical protein [Xanthovirga aplysinae]MTI30953.1 hypothetical protein [Xanthovirga aplysinae]